MCFPPSEPVQTTDVSTCTPDQLGQGFEIAYRNRSVFAGCCKGLLCLSDALRLRLLSLVCIVRELENEAQRALAEPGH